MEVCITVANIDSRLGQYERKDRLLLCWRTWLLGRMGMGTDYCRYAGVPPVLYWPLARGFAWMLHAWYLVLVACRPPNAF